MGNNVSLNSDNTLISVQNQQDKILGIKSFNYLNSDKFTIINLIPLEIKKNDEYKKIMEIIYLKYLNNVNMLYVNVFKKCNFDTNDNIFKDLIPNEEYIDIYKTTPNTYNYLHSLMFTDMLGFYYRGDNKKNYVIIIPNSYLLKNSDFIKLIKDE